MSIIFYIFLLLNFSFITHSLAIEPAYDPGQFIKQIDPSEEHKLKEDKEILPKTLPTKNLGVDQNLDQQFILKQIILTGNKTIDQSKLELLYQDLITQKITIKQLELIKDKITQYYLDHDYVFSYAQLTNYNVNSGVVEIKIIEGAINKVIIKGQAEHNQQLIELFNNLQANKPLKRSQLERTVLLAKELYGLEVVYKFVPVIISTTNQPTTDLMIATKEDQLAASFNIDNRSSKSTGPLKASANLELYSLFKINNKLNLSIDTAQNTTKFKHFKLAYEQIINSYGTKLGLEAGLATINPESLIFNPKIVKNQKNYANIYLKLPLILASNNRLNLKLGFGIDDNQSKIKFLQNSVENIRLANIGFDYFFKDSLKGLNFLEVKFNHGIDGLGSKLTSYSELKPKAKLAFNRININYLHFQPLINEFFLMINIAAQHSSDYLPSSQKVAFGGRELGRGFDIATVSGDKGIASSIELQRLLTLTHPIIKNIEPYLFYDFGITTNKHQQIKYYKNQHLASSGFGIRVELLNQLKANFELAAPLSLKKFKDHKKLNHQPKYYLGLSYQVKY